MFLGTDANKTVFWIEREIDEVLENLERTPGNKFYLIKATGTALVLKPVTVAAAETERTYSVRVARADNQDLN